LIITLINSNIEENTGEGANPSSVFWYSLFIFDIDPLKRDSSIPSSLDRKE
jgi:hypothetical protein